MSFLGVSDTLAGAYQYANRTQKISTNRTGFTEQLQKTGEAADTSEVEAYTEYLRSKYCNVRIQSIGKDQKSLDRAGKSMSGSDVVIAPNILEQMANDPKKASYYEGQIRHYFDTLPQCSAQLSLLGHEIHSSGIVIHPDGTVTHYISGDLKPEVRARIEARIKAESEEKARRKWIYQKRSEESARLRAIAENSRAMHDAARPQVNSCGLILGQ